jgi:hypothetical protein
MDFCGMKSQSLFSFSTACNFACPKIYLPVCGSDGKTYGNACELRRADCKSPGKIYIIHNGPCCKNN